MSEATEIKESWEDSSGEETTSTTATTTSPAHTHNVNTPENKSENNNKDNTDTIDSIEPVSQEDFTRFESILKKKITSFDRSPLYADFLGSLMKDLCNNLELDDIKRISNTLTAVSTEKSKLNKQLKPKKKNKKAVLAAGKNNNMMETYGDEDFDDDYDI